MAFHEPLDGLGDRVEASQQLLGLAAFRDPDGLMTEDRDPHVRMVLSVGRLRQLRRLRALLRARPVSWPGRRPAFAVCVRRPLLTPAVVAELRSGAGRVVTWPVDTSAELADARRLGVSGVISKNLTLLRELVAR